MCLAAAFAARGAASAEGRAPRPGAPADAPSAEPASDEAEKTAAAGEAETFEGLAQSAQAAGDVGALVGALVDRCADDKRPGEREGEHGHERSIDRARCRATLAFLRKALPEHPFSVVAPDAAAISVSPYDETLKGYRVGLSACVACTSPIRVGRSPDPVFVTLKKPGEAGESRRASRRGEARRHPGGSGRGRVGPARVPVAGRGAPVVGRRASPSARRADLQRDGQRVALPLDARLRAGPGGRPDRRQLHRHRRRLGAAVDRPRRARGRVSGQPRPVQVRAARRDLARRELYHRQDRGAPRRGHRHQRRRRRRGAAAVRAVAQRDRRGDGADPRAGLRLLRTLSACAAPCP